MSCQVIALSSFVLCYESSQPGHFQGNIEPTKRLEVACVAGAIFLALGRRPHAKNLTEACYAN